jgi:secondary thiamine-phosphate synthase enzyme
MAGATCYFRHIFIFSSGLISLLNDSRFFHARTQRGCFLESHFMFTVYNAEFVVRTKGNGTYEVTEKVAELVRASQVRTGLVNVFLRHTSASLLIFENADPSARRDLEKFFERLVPEGAAYFSHTMEGPDDMPSHIRMALTRTSESIPIAAGQLQLGTWQGLFLYEHRAADAERSMVVSVIGTTK